MQCDGNVKLRRRPNYWRCLSELVDAAAKNGYMHGNCFDFWFEIFYFLFSFYFIFYSCFIFYFYILLYFLQKYSIMGSALLFHNANETAAWPQCHGKLLNES